MNFFDKDAPLGMKIVNAAALAVTVVFFFMNIAYVFNLLSYVTVSATVIDTFSVANTENSIYYVTYEYQYNGNTYHANARTNYSDSFTVGREDKIKINPKSPTQLKDSYLLGGYAVIDTALIAVLFWLSFVTGKKIKENKSFNNRTGKSYLESDYEIEMREKNHDYNLK